MTLQYSKIDKFKKEVRYFEKEIQNIKNLKVKEQARNLLDELYHQARLLDEGFQLENNPEIKPYQLVENRDTTIELRRKLHKLISNLKST